MNKNHLNWLFLTLTILVVTLAIISEIVYFSDFEYKYQTRRFNRLLHEKEKILDQCVTGMEPILARGEPHGSVAEKMLYSLAEKNEITILEYLDDKLIYWSDNNFDVPLFIEDSTYTQPIIFLQNGWFIPRKIRAANEVIVGLLRVRTDYGFENEIIRNGYVSHYRIPDNVGFSTDKNASGYIIYGSRGTFLFSLLFPEEKSNSPLMIIPLFFWGLFFVLVMFFSHDLVKTLSNTGRKAAGIALCLLVYLLIYLLLLISGKPEVIFRTGLFSSYVFTLNGFIPSLGHLVILSILAVDIAFMIFTNANFGFFSGRRKAGYSIVAVLIILSLLLTYCLHLLFRDLIADSNISFEAYKVLTISFFSVTGFASVVLLFLVPVLFIFAISKLIMVLTEQGNINTDTGNLKRRFFNISIVFSLVFGIYSLLMITMYSEKRITENMKVQALSLSTENDPEAEHLLLDMWPVISNDTILRRMMNNELFQENFAAISGYLTDTYFNAYWGNYYFSISLCRSDDPLQIGQTGELVDNCFGFFSERVRKYGHRLADSGFWFIDNQGGRSYYFGQMLFKQKDNIVHGLFISLYSNVNVFQPGYSELLLDRKFRGYSGLKDYSFAKYINGGIVLKSGDFPYNKEDDDYVDKNSDYRIFKAEDYNHILYKNGNATVIISRPVLKAEDVLITFAYLFSFTFLFVNLLLLAVRKPGIKSLGWLNFRQKLQISFIGILLFSFILIGVVVTLLTIKEYRSKHYENVTEKLNSIYLELDNKLANEKTIGPDWRSSTDASLNELLVRLSNIFNTDINLYNLNGFLMATSREEIYYRDLAGLRMNNMALINMKDLTRSLYTQTETIGRLKYVSAYVPFYNISNNVLAYLNLPYFRMQSLLAREISNLVVAVVNFTLLLVLVTMGFAVFISGRLTSPLSMLSQGLASVELGKKSEHLNYRGSDEIGELVKQYNRMVDELDESAGKLADSEREYAWREMAKQIAHEIKNPLTPMKLNVQQLLKSWNDKAPGFNEKIEVFATNQIEYIDSLSSIASAFSSFAKMPGSKPADIDLLEQVKSTLELFKNTDNVTFEVQWPHESKIFIYADREHLNGIFSNLFKNSIQAIPPGRKGLVRVTTEIAMSRVIISVHDNGEGIPEDLKKKMFTPNFTTKSSGTGLGLSIVKKYVEGTGGRVWFESEAGKGTVFHIDFPLKYTVERPGFSHNV